MGSPANPQAQSPQQAWLDEGLAAGSLVVASNERAARSLTAAYHRARRAQGLTAWPAPAIQDWDSFVRATWLARTPDPRMILNAQQEQSLWAEIVAAHGPAPPLEGPRHRIARLAMDAHGLLCSYAPRFLHARARTYWQQDAAAFSRWLDAFDDACRSAGFLSAARLPLELTSALAADASPRFPLLLAGFDRTLPIQRDLFAAWGSAQSAPRGQPAAHVSFHRSPDEAAELAACALWCKQRLRQSPLTRLLVITQDAAQRRGEIERAFLRHLGNSPDSTVPSHLFEFSLGVPLNQVALARGALLVLRWLDAPLEEPDLDWLISTGYLASDKDESRALAAFLRALRRRGLERTQWPLAGFINQNAAEPLPAGWAARITQAQRRLRDFSRAHTASRQREASASPLVWAECASQLLQAAGWPGGRALTSAEHQALNRWNQALDASASLGFTGQPVTWRVFLSSLERTLGETLFAPESQDAPILIAGPAESAGLEADGIRFLGATEDAWPAAGASHPLLPLDVQREAGMPHSSAQLDWSLADSITSRLLASAPEIQFSYARMTAGVETRPSRLILKAAGAPQELPASFVAPPVPAPQTVWIEDASQIPFPGGSLRGGATVLTAQSQCPFKAFAIARLGAERWKPAQAGLTPAERGALLHHVLHSIWSGPPEGIRSHADLLARLDSLQEFVQLHVARVCASKMPPAALASMPPAYLALEQTRLTALVSEWLRYETARIPFSVADTELETEISIGGPNASLGPSPGPRPDSRLDLRLRLDRVDRLSDGSLLVIDYKSGDVSPKLWDLPRPDDVQLPLYAGFALASGPDPLGGLVFARVRAGESSFAGRMAAARATLLADLTSANNLVRKPLSPEDLIAWRGAIEDLARDFLRGRADVDPRDYPKTCEECGLQTLCRIEESRAAVDSEDDEDAEAEDA
jgi:probable DNA repair protein